MEASILLVMDMTSREQQVSRIFRRSALTLLLAVCSQTGSAAASQGADERVDQLTQEALQADIHRMRGAQLFDQHCAKCHGAQAFGDAYQGVPALAGQRFAYLTRQLANFSGGERDSPTMHGVVHQQELHQPQDWADIAGFLNLQPGVRVPQVGSANRQALGRAMFREQCASCHGRDATGDADGFVPSLRHQHHAYLVKQMHKLAGGYRHNVDESLVLFLRSFDDDEIDAVAAYLSRLRGNVEHRRTLRSDGLAVN